jgi:hypothetical protein
MYQKLLCIKVNKSYEVYNKKWIKFLKNSLRLCLKT